VNDISINQLELFLDYSNLDSNKKTTIQILSFSINDWPDKILSLKEYELKLFEFINLPITKKNLTSTLKQIDYSKYSWQAESISQLIEVFDLNPGFNEFSEIVNYYISIYFEN
jgi:hypothetical protein